MIYRVKLIAECSSRLFIKGFLIFLLAVFFAYPSFGQSKIKQPINQVSKLNPEHRRFEIGNKESRQYSYRQFSTNNGLLGNTVYSINQDSKGFIWMATGMGLIQFNGEQFTNYSTFDGLAGNVIFEAIEDKRGRIWVRGLYGQLSYIENGTVIQPNIKEFSKKFNSAGFFEEVFPLNKDTILLKSSREDLHYLVNDSAIFIDFNKLKPLKEFQVESEGITFSLKEFGHFFVLNRGKNYSTKLIKTDRFTSYSACRLTDGSFLFIVQGNSIWHYKDEEIIVYDLDKEITAIAKHPNGNILLSFGGSGGSIECSLGDDGFKIVHHFFNNESVFGTIIDQEGSYWFATKSTGVRHMANPNIKIFNSESGALHMPLYDILKVGNSSVPKQVLALPANNKPYLLRFDDSSNFQKAIDPPIRNIQQINQLDKHRYSIETPHKKYIWKDNNTLEKVTEQGINVFRETFKQYKWTMTRTDIVRLDTTTFISDTILQWVRGTGWFSKQKDTLWLGTLEGLYKWWPDTMVFLGDKEPFINKRISGLDTFESQLFVSTRGGGLFVKSPSGWKQYAQNNGLLGNIITNTTVDKIGKLWVSTENGVTIFSPYAKDPSFYYLTYSSGLISKGVERILIFDDEAWINTDVGIAIFPISETLTEPKSTPYILSISANTNSFHPNQNIEFNHKENNIRIDFGLIKYKNRVNERFQYRLYSGKKGDWIHTTIPNVQFHDLGPREYIFELSTSNFSGTSTSETIQTKFWIKPAFWQTWWFKLILILLFSALIALIWRWRLNNIRFQNNLRERLIESRQHALAAQMNPHFVFNALNSVERYILENDQMKAIAFIGKFSQLIRRFFEQSLKSFISLNEELETVETYISLEHERFNKKFNYTINVDEKIDWNKVLIPSGIIQPIVENSIKHGLINKRGKKELVLNVKSTDRHIIIEVKDNGIGRQKSSKQREGNDLNRKSRGMALIRKRIEINRLLFKRDIRMHIEDLKDAENKVAGTLVSITIEQQ
jgi:hypothetical protein